MLSCRTGPLRAGRAFTRLFIASRGPPVGREMEFGPGYGDSASVAKIPAGTKHFQRWENLLRGEQNARVLRCAQNDKQNAAAIRVRIKNYPAGRARSARGGPVRQDSFLTAAEFKSCSAAMMRRLDSSARHSKSPTQWSGSSSLLL